jgi:hypothetical protein
VIELEDDEPEAPEVIPVPESVEGPDAKDDDD